MLRAVGKLVQSLSEKNALLHIEVATVCHNGSKNVAPQGTLPSSSKNLIVQYVLPLKLNSFMLQ